ncbi:MAG: nucleotide exchange factor GrpE [Lachnospiraceae bacterium]|nr:nucleotide exchange factor GrpE [Lachnospiraceae bacterium]
MSEENKNEEVVNDKEENTTEATSQEEVETTSEAETEEAGADSEADAKPDKKEQKYKEQIAELNDRYVRQLAEFENFRNRTQKEKEAMFEVGAKSIIEKILPVVDNFERGIAALTDDEKEGAFAKGMQGVYKQLIDELDKLEVKEIEAVGQEFDPNLHNAVMQVESEEYESGVVAAELQKGYTYRGQVVRYSMVSVVQ